MDPTARPTEPSVPTAAEGRAWWAFSVYLVLGLGVALLFVTAYVIVAAPGLFKVDLPGALLGIAAFLIGLALLDRLPREVRVGPDGVEFIYVLSRIVLRWDQLAAPTDVGKGFVAFRAVTGAHGVWGSLTVTAAQAQRILSYPSCPAFDLPDTFASSMSTS